MMMENVAFLSEFEPFEHLLAEEDKLGLENFIEPEAQSCHLDTPIIQIVVTLLKENINCFYVVDENHKLLGVISAKEIVKNVLRG